MVFAPQRRPANGQHRAGQLLHSVEKPTRLNGPRGRIVDRSADNVRIDPHRVVHQRPHRLQHGLRAAEHLNRFEVQLNALGGVRMLPIVGHHLTEEALQCDVGYVVGWMAHDRLLDVRFIIVQRSENDVGFDELHVAYRGGQ